MNYKSNLIKYRLRKGGKLHQFLLISLVALLCFTLLLGLLISRNQSRQIETLDNYGYTITQLAANQLAVPMNAGNLIGMQSLLNELTKQDRVINAITYNVDNQVLVQAGAVSNIPKAHKTYTRAITLDKTHYGSLTLSLDATLTQDYLIYSGLFLLLLATAFCGLTLLPQQSTTDIIDNEQSTAKTDKQLIASKETTEHYQAVALLGFHGLDKIRQQLNAEARQQVFHTLQANLNKVLKLYSGQQLGSNENTLAIGFNGDDQMDCLFNAICCAYLLQQISEKNQWLLRFTAHISLASDNITQDMDLATIKPIITDKNNYGKLFINSTLIQKYQLSSRFECNQTDANTTAQLTCIEGFTGNYQQLLNNQLQHLL